jgi:hypothetical protein
MRGWTVNLYEEWLAREKRDKEQAAAEACKARADAGLAEIEECRHEMRRLFEEFKHHLQALGFAFKPSEETLQ